MQSLRNLRLALRLALAFGALAFGLLLVGGRGPAARSAASKHETTELSDRDLQRDRARRDASASVPL